LTFSLLKWGDLCSCPRGLGARGGGTPYYPPPEGSIGTLMGTVFDLAPNPDQTPQLLTRKTVQRDI